MLKPRRTTAGEREPDQEAAESSESEGGARSSTWEPGPLPAVRPYKGSARAKYAPHLTQEEWQRYGQKRRKELIAEEAAKEAEAAGDAAEEEVF